MNTVTEKLSRTIDTLLHNTGGKLISLEFVKTSRRVETTAEEINNEVARIFQISKINTAEFYWIKTCDRIQIIGWEGVEPHDIPFSGDSIYGNTNYELSLKNPEIRKRYKDQEETRESIHIFSTHKKIFESKEIPSGCELFPASNMWIDGIEQLGTHHYVNLISTVITESKFHAKIQSVYFHSEDHVGVLKIK